MKSKPALQAALKKEIDEDTAIVRLGVPRHQLAEALKKEAEGQDTKAKPPDKSKVAVVGRVSGPSFTPEENSRIQAQMRLLSDGYFSAHARVGVPIGFRLHGYQPLDYVPQGSDGFVEYAGELQLKKTPAAEQASLKGSVILEGADGLARPTVSVTLSDHVENINWSDNSAGIEPGSRGRTVQGSSTPDGRFSFLSLSPIGYTLVLSAKDYVTERRYIRFDAREAKLLEPITLYRKRTGQLWYMVSPSGDFSATPPQAEPLILDGSGWKAVGGKAPAYGSDFFQHQYGEAVAFRFTYAPVFVFRLGPGKLEDFRNVAVDRISIDFNDQPRFEAMRKGEVYLLRQESWKQWIMLTMTDL
jgi:hypothetical protein